MQWTNDKNYQNESQTDVYSDIQKPYSTTFFGSEQGAEQQTQEFSLEEIERKLGIYNPSEEQVNVVSKGDEKPSNQTLNMAYDRDYSAIDTRAKSRRFDTCIGACRNFMRCVGYKLVRSNVCALFRVCRSGRGSCRFDRASGYRRLRRA